VNTRRLWTIVIILACLAPLGLWLPQHLRASGAWGEWGPEELGKQVGSVPRGMARSSDLWRAPLPDYAPKGTESRSLLVQSIWYVASAFIGVAVCGLFIWLLGRRLARREHPGVT
jgi:hypothetical protein